MSQNKVQEAKERAKALLERADTLVTNRLILKTGQSSTEDTEQRVYDLRALIGARETLRGELEQHRMRRGRLTELHDELNIAEEQLATIKLDINEHQMALVDTQQKMVDLEGHMQIVMNDLVNMRDQFPKLQETEFYHQGQVDALGRELSEAEKVVVKKKQLVKETEENLNYIMNVGMSSQMWSTEGETSPGGLSHSRSSKRMSLKKWSSVGRLKGEDIIYHKEELTPRTDAWATKHRESKTKYLWRVVFNAMKLGYLTRKIPFPPEAFTRMMEYIHGSNEAEQIKQLQEQLTANQRIVEDQADVIRRLERLNQQKSAKSKDAETRLAALQDKYEKARIENAALRTTLAELNDKSIAELRHENELYAVERKNLYQKLYGNKTKNSGMGSPLSRSRSIVIDDMSSANFSLPSAVEIPPITESKLAREDGGARSASSNNLKRIPTLSETVLEAKKSVERRVSAFNAAPNGVGFLQQQLDRHIEEQRLFRKQIDQVRFQRCVIQQKLEQTECIALHAFDSFARGRQTVEEEIQQIIVENQKTQKRFIERQMQEKMQFENQILQLTATVANLQRDNTASQELIKSLEEKLSNATNAKEVFESQLESTTAQLAEMSAKIDPQEYASLLKVQEKLSTFQPQSIIDNDLSIGRILPMKNQRAFAQLVSKLVAAVHQSLLFASSNMATLFNEAVRKTPSSSSIGTTVGDKIDESFEALMQACSTVGRTGLDAIQTWEASRRDANRDKETDVEDLPQPVQQVVYVDNPVAVEAVVVKPETLDQETQCTHSGSQDEGTQTASSLKKDMSVETTIVLGQGQGEGLGFVSADQMKRQEELLKAKMQKADEEERAAIVARKSAAAKVEHLQGIQEALNKKMMDLEDRTVALQSRNVQLEAKFLNRSDGSSQVEAGDLPEGTREFQSQIYFEEADSSRLRILSLAPATAAASQASLCCEAFGTNVPEKEVVSLRSFSDASAQCFVDLAHKDSQTESTRIDSSFMQNSRCSSATTSPRTLERQLSARGNTTAACRFYSRSTSPLSPLACGAGGLFMSSVAIQADDAGCVSPVAVVTAPVSLPTFSVPTAGDFASPSQSPTPRQEPVMIPVVDEELTAKAIAELEQLLESRLTSEFDQHRQLLEEQIQARAEDFDRHQQQVDTDAIRLRVKVSDMQQNYEAIAASVNKFKFVARQLENAKAELELERRARQLLDAQLHELQKSHRGGPESHTVNPTSKTTTTAFSTCLTVEQPPALMLRKPKNITEDAVEVATRQLRREKESLALQLEQEKGRVDALEQQLQKSSDPKKLSVGLSSPGNEAIPANVMRATRRLQTMVKKEKQSQLEAANASEQSGDRLGDHSTIVAMSDRMNDLQIQLFQARNDVAEAKAKFSHESSDNIKEMERLRAQLAIVESALKKSQAAEQRTRQDVHREFMELNDAVAVGKMQLDQVNTNHRREIAKRDAEIENLKKITERAEKQSIQLKSQLQAANKSMEEFKTTSCKDAQLFAVKSRVAATLISQLHCALVETAVAIKASFQLNTLQLADSMMGETAVQLMRSLQAATEGSHAAGIVADETTEAQAAAGGIRVSSELLIELSKRLGDRDVELLRRLSHAAKYHAGQDTSVSSLNVSRPVTADGEMHNRQDVSFSTLAAATPLPLTPVKEIPPVTLPHIELRAHAPPKPVRLDIHVEHNQTFSLMRRGVDGSKADVPVTSQSKTFLSQPLPLTTAALQKEIDKERIATSPKRTLGAIRSVPATPEESLDYVVGRTNPASSADGPIVAHRRLPMRLASRNEAKRKRAVPPASDQ